MLDWLKAFFTQGDGSSHYRIYFVICALLFTQM